MLPVGEHHVITARSWQVSVRGLWLVIYPGGHKVEIGSRLTPKQLRDMAQDCLRAADELDRARDAGL